MKTLEWQSRYEIGIKEIDDQHKHLVDVINDLIIAKNENKLDEQIGKALKELVAYTQYHFKSEEEFMEKIKYPALPEHRAQHKVLVKQLVKILEDLKDGKIEAGEQLPDILQNWLIKHVFGHDRHIALYLRDE